MLIFRIVPASLLQVVDEADRLLKQSYHGWLENVLQAVDSHQDAVASLPPPQRLVKLVVSATLTHDPSKLAKLSLQAPRCKALTNAPGFAPCFVC
jgi:superfamily II DNA/RNA helicase